jgi:gas vesicle protein
MDVKEIMAEHSDKNSLNPDQEDNSRKALSCYHSRNITILSILFSSAVTISVWIFVMLVIFRPGFFSYFGFASKYFLKNPSAINNNGDYEKIVDLVSNGTILSLDDLWNFQTGFYQTIIAVLIGINAILGALSFFIIRNSSGAVAREEASKEVHTHLKSKIFDKSIKRVIYKKFEAHQIDLDEQFSTMESIASEFNKLIIELENIKKENEKIKGEILIITNAVSSRDTDELYDGANFTLNEKVN